MRRLTSLLALIGMLSGGALLQAQNAPAKATRLLTSTAPSLVKCAPVTLMPCMSMGVTPVDDAGHPAPIALPPAQHLASAVTMVSGDSGAQVTPFYVTSGEGPDSAQHVNVILMMIDISGSMNQPAPGSVSRFAAVKSAISRYVENMQEGSDEIAIVPFESHTVISTIHAAVFSSRKADVLAALNALPQPAGKNNTALFQAVYTGADTLKNELSTLEHDGHAASELQPHLIVMTDGKNEVLPGDDPQLLTGPLGLEQAAQQVTTSHMDVIAVGFGDRAAIDADALRKLSTRFFYAADADQLLNALHVTRTARSHVLEIAWLIPATSRAALTGRDQIWTPMLTADNGGVLKGDPVKIVMPAAGLPMYARAASAPELVALIATHPATSSGWSTFLVYLLLFLGACALLVILWFWVPRLIWDAATMATPPARWSTGGGARPGDRPAVTSASAVQIRSTNLPAGFTPKTATGKPLERSPAQTTQVGPRSEATRTRLNFD